MEAGAAPGHLQRVDMDQKLPLPAQMSAPPAQPATSHESLSLDTLAVMGAPAAPGPGTSLGQMSYFCSVQAGLQDYHWHMTMRIACIINDKASGSHVKVWDVLAGERCHARPCALTHSSAAGRWLAAR